MLAVSLPVFLLAELPMVGYAVCAAAWIAASAMQLAADRHVKRSLARGNRNSALGTLAAATLGRVWLVALAILLVGLSDRDAGLAAAVLAAALVTVHLAGMAIGRLISSDEEAAVSARRSMRAPSIGRSPTARRQAGGRDVGGGGRGI